MIDTGGRLMFLRRDLSRRRRADVATTLLSTTLRPSLVPTVLHHRRDRRRLRWPPAQHTLQSPRNGEMSTSTTGCKTASRPPSKNVPTCPDAWLRRTQPATLPTHRMNHGAKDCLTISRYRVFMVPCSNGHKSGRMLLACRMRTAPSTNGSRTRLQLRIPRPQLLVASRCHKPSRWKLRLRPSLGAITTVSLSKVLRNHNQALIKHVHLTPQLTFHSHSSKACQSPQCTRLQRPSNRLTLGNNLNSSNNCTTVPCTTDSPQMHSRIFQCPERPIRALSSTSLRHQTCPSVPAPLVQRNATPSTQPTTSTTLTQPTNTRNSITATTSKRLRASSVASPATALA